MGKVADNLKIPGISVIIEGKDSNIEKHRKRKKGEIPQMIYYN